MYPNEGRRQREASLIHCVLSYNSLSTMLPVRKPKSTESKDNCPALHPQQRIANSNFLIKDEKGTDVGAGKLCGTPVVKCL